jgi:hypothetical protein
MVTLWNPADEAQNLVFTLFFAGGSYRYPVPLGPRATRTFNVSEIIQSQIPDENGNTIPAGVHEGSAEIAGIQAEQEHILVAMAAGTYNVRKATCAGSCITCNGYTGVDEFDFLDGSIPVGSATTVTYSLLNNSGTYVNVSNSSTWSSSNAGIATVNTPGTVGGVAVGSFTAYATSSYQPEYSKFVCPTGDSVNCPEKEFQSSGGGIVVPKPTVTFSPISSVLVGQTATTTATVSPTSNALPISLSINSPAAVVTPAPGTTFTQTNTLVTVKGLSAGTASITATVPNSDGGQPITVGSTSFPVIQPVPVNFRQIAAQDVGGGNLKFTYEWDSSTGNLADIASCQVGESVAYPGTGSFNWTGPPYDTSGNPTANPTTGSFSGSDGGFYDNQLHPGFLKPYVANGFTATQTFNYNCGAGAVALVSNISIVRTVQQNGTAWTYTVTKSGSSASVALP